MEKQVWARLVGDRGMNAIAATIGKCLFNRHTVRNDLQ